MAQTLRTTLQLYGIRSPQDFYQRFPQWSYFHLRQVWFGRRPLSKKLGLAIKAFTKGLVSLDMLLELNRKELQRHRARTRSKPHPPIR